MRSDGQRSFDIPTCFPLERCSLTSSTFPSSTQSKKRGIEFLKCKEEYQEGEKTSNESTNLVSPMGETTGGNKVSFLFYPYSSPSASHKVKLLSGYVSMVQKKYIQW